MSLSLIEIKKGMHLSVNDIGNPAGAPIIVNHGMIDSIMDAALFNSLIKAGKRIISIARPGYGCSSAFELQNIADWGTVIHKIVKKMRNGQFDQRCHSE